MKSAAPVPHYPWYRSGTLSSNTLGKGDSHIYTTSIRVTALTECSIYLPIMLCSMTKIFSERMILVNNMFLQMIVSNYLCHTHGAELREKIFFFIDNRNVIGKV